MDKNKMLIDATHPEETRVVVLRNGRVEEFDFESAARKLLRGNIYLAKVTRVEPSLQAAFVDYGGNRHGFLAFTEIHPDYYQIPIADREALKQEEAEAEAAAEAEADERARYRDSRRRQRQPKRDLGPDDGSEHDGGRARDAIDGEPLAHDRDSDPAGSDVRRSELHEDDSRSIDRGSSDPLDVPEAADNVDDIDARDGDGNGDNGSGDAEQVEEIATEEDALEEVPERPRRRIRQYKIQEVIKRRQIILIQVVKEERGTKGAALTTYISLAGRYTVLMPNTGRGGGISRKITQPQDRKRLKAIAEELEVSEGMGLIIRTAGAARTKQEVKRDYEYLLRLWESVRDMTLSSTAPCLVYEEGNLIKRSIRDLYSKDISDIQVAGDSAYREASEFMAMLMPGHTDDVVRYEAPEPLFARFGIERQLNAMFNPTVTLRSGGYIVINQTEALVAIDVNSGKSTREFSIEETALNTNLEAAEEIARQLKLRDLAGLIVVDFIDMEEKRNNRKVESRMKDALRHDRARIQVGRISHFGLLEMSRQRLRTGVIEGSTLKCPHCEGTGIVRSTESVALAVLRSLEDQLNKQPASLVATTTAPAALYILNHKRGFVTEMERRFGITISVEASDHMHGASFSIERNAAAPEPTKPMARAAVSMDWGFEGEETSEEDRAPPRRDWEREKDRGRDQSDRDRGERHRGGDDRTDRDRADREPDDRDVVEPVSRDARRGDRDVAAPEGEEQGPRRRRRRGRRDREDTDGRDGARGHSAAERPPNGAEPAPEARATKWREDEGRGGTQDEPRQGADEAAVDGGPAGERDAAPRDEDREDRARRGRRRGRRGGRARGRDGETSGSHDRAPEGGSSRSDDWNVPDVARPGAEQPARSAASERSADPPEPRQLAASGPTAAEAVPSEPSPRESVETRYSIVESVRASEASRQREPAAEPPQRPAPSTSEPSQPARKGWWQRRFGGGE